MIGVAQTGTGKTAAFVLPLLETLVATPSQKRMRVLVVAPTRELVAQIEENVRAYGRHLRLRYRDHLRRRRRRPADPGAARRRRSGGRDARPADRPDGTAARQLCRRSRCSCSTKPIACSTWAFCRRSARSSRPRRRRGRRCSSRPPCRRRSRRSRKEFLRTPVLVEIGARSTPVEAVAQWVVEVSMAAKVPALVHLLKDAALESVLVFSRTKHGADRIARKLEGAGIRCATLHSNRTQGQRIAGAQALQVGRRPRAVATDIAARGIDVDGISHVINYDFPPQPEDYVHRIGRTGRAQAIGDAISFVSHDEMDDLRRLERFLGRGIARQKAGRLRRQHSASPFAFSYGGQARFWRRRRIANRPCPRSQRPGGGGNRPRAAGGSWRPKGFGRQPLRAQQRAARASRPDIAELVAMRAARV